jgi:hypothetical protein
LYDEKFFCKNKDCVSFEREKKNYVWDDRDKNPDCINCGVELHVYAFIKNTAPAHLKFAGMSADEKRKTMKARSNEHFHKKMKESWLYQNTRSD